MKAVLFSLALALALAFPAAATGRASGQDKAPCATRVEAYFTPGDDVARVIAERIGNARQSVQVLAYLFTSRRIATALANAAKRGVEVDLVGDAKQHEARGLPVLKQLDRAGVRIWLHGDHAAFHNKVVLIDAGTPASVIVTGSYNFTQAAQERNAENIVVITGSPAAAARYARDFYRHRAAASRLQ
ncbi:MAG: phospholipase D family protein [Betaproteobacteria bacterium]|nr:phospholipase D family protein [Betaproteobacteria bacterium]